MYHRKHTINDYSVSFIPSDSLSDTSFSALAIMALYSFLSFVAFNNTWSFRTPLCPCGTYSNIHLLEFIK